LIFLNIQNIRYIDIYQYIMTEIFIGKAIATFVTAGTVLDLTARVSGSIGSLLCEDNDKVKKCLKRLDLKAKLKSVESTIIQCQKYNVSTDIKISNSQVSTESKPIDNLESLIIEDYLAKPRVNISDNPIDIHIYYLYEIIKEIESEIKNITENIRNHRNKMFSSYRKSNVDNLLDNLEVCDILLKQRYDRFVNLLDIPFMHKKYDKNESNVISTH
jgi:hypothetical protein